MFSANKQYWAQLNFLTNTMVSDRKGVCDTVPHTVTWSWSVPRGKEWPDPSRQRNKRIRAAWVQTEKIQACSGSRRLLPSLPATLSPGRVFSGEQVDTPPPCTQLLPRSSRARSQQRGHSAANTPFPDTALHMPQQHPYLVKIGKTVRVLTQTLVLSPESVTSSYFPELLQVNDIQCTGQRRPFVTAPPTRDGSLGKHSGFHLKGKWRPESGSWGQ